VCVGVCVCVLVSAYEMTWLQRLPERSTYNTEQKVSGTRGGLRVVGVIGGTVGGWRRVIWVFQKHRFSVKGGGNACVRRES